MRISIGLKLMLLVGVCTFILAVAGLYGTWNSWESIHAIHQGLDNASEQQQDIDDIRSAYSTEIQEWKNLLLRSTDDASLKKYWDLYEAQYGKVVSATSQMLNKPGDEQAKPFLKSFSEAHRDNHDLYRKATLILKEQKFDNRPADHAVVGIDRPLKVMLQQASHEVNLEGDVIGSQVVDLAERKIYISLAIGFVVAVLEGLFFLIMIRRLITTPTTKVLAGLNSLKSGNFTEIPPTLYNDEFGEIAESTQMVSQELGQLIASVKAAAGQLAKTAERVAKVSNMTSEGVKNQRDETDNASLSISEMSRSMVLSVESANYAVSTAENVSTHVSVVSDVLGKTVSAVQAMADEHKNTANAIQTLKDETQSIGDVAKTIRSIADQTNMLALNAAIEAARAGEHGRGFAVVADEVRKLAQTTQEATNEIELRISTLQSGASNAMIAMLNGSDRADKGVDQALEARKVLDSIILAAASIREVNGKIAADMETQKDVAGTISRTIMNISQVAEQTSYSSRQSSEEIVKVADEAAHLNALVSKFIIPPSMEVSTQHQHTTKDDSVELF